MKLPAISTANERVLDGDLTGKPCAECRDHIRKCAECQSILESCRDTIAWFRRDAAGTGPLPAALHDKVMRTIQSRGNPSRLASRP